MLSALTALPLLSAAADEGPTWAVSFDPPAAVVSALHEVRTAFDVVGRCDESSQRLGLGTRYAQIENRYYAAFRRAEGIWGNTISRDAEQSMLSGEPADCQRANILQAMDDAEFAFDKEDKAFAEATLAMMRGAWAGPLKLCQDTVLSAEPGFEAAAGQPTVVVRLQPGFASALGSITERSVSGSLAIRLDGEMISEPTVYERIDGGQFQVTGPDLPVLEHLSDAVGRPC